MHFTGEQINKQFLFLQQFILSLWDMFSEYCKSSYYHMEHFVVYRHWAIYCTFGNFSKPVATIILPKLPTFQSNFVKVSKSFIFLVKSFLGNFCRHLATFYRSHCDCQHQSAPIEGCIELKTDHSVSCTVFVSLKIVML